MAELVAKTYARAIFEIAMEDDKLDAVYQELCDVKKVFIENPEFYKLFRAMNVPREERKSIMDEVFGSALMEEVHHFIKLLIDKNRVNEFMDICRAYESMMKDHRGILSGIVFSKYPLDDEQLSTLEAKMSQTSGKQVTLTQQIDDTMIGGIRVQLGDKMLDYSVRKKLQDMKQELRQLTI